MMISSVATVHLHSLLECRHVLVLMRVVFSALKFSEKKTLTRSLIRFRFLRKIKLVCLEKTLKHDSNSTEKKDSILPLKLFKSLFNNPNSPEQIYDDLGPQKNGDLWEL